MSACKFKATVVALLTLLSCLNRLPARAALVVPGTDSSVDLHVDGSLIWDMNTPLTWNQDQHILAGANWPNPTNPPNAAAWTLDPGTMTIGIPPVDYAAGHTIAAFGYNYLPQETDVLVRSSSTGTAVGAIGNSFNVHSTVNGMLNMWLEPTAAGDVGAFFNVTVTVRITGSQLSAGSNAHAFMNHSSRIDPLIGGNPPVTLTGQYSDVTLPPLNPNPPPLYLIEQTVTFQNIQAGSDFTLVDLGVNGLDGLLTSTNGATTLQVASTSGNSIFDSTMSLDFVVTAVPEPVGWVPVLGGSLGVLAFRRRKSPARYHA